MIVLEGLPALSPFRLERLQSRLQQVVPGVRLAGAWFTYFIEPEAGAAPGPVGPGAGAVGSCGSASGNTGAESSSEAFDIGWAAVQKTEGGGV